METLDFQSALMQRSYKYNINSNNGRDNLESLWSLPFYVTLGNLFFRGPRSNLSDRPNEDYSLWCGHNARAKCHSPLTISPHTPLWGNPTLSHLRSISDPSLWAARGVVCLKYIMSDGRLMGFSNLKAKYNSYLIICLEYTLNFLCFSFV